MARAYASWPWLTGAVVLLAGLIAATDNGAAWATLERDGSGGWRWWTTHLVHVSTEHLLASGLVWLAAGAAVERVSRGSVVLLLLAGAPAIAWVALTAESGMRSYVGLSGLACGCIAWLGLELTWGGRVNRRARLLGTALLGGLIIRIAWDLLSNGTAWMMLGEASMEGPFRVARHAHLAGALAGAVCWAGACIFIRVFDRRAESHHGSKSSVSRTP